MIDEKTPYLQLPLPNAANLLDEDVERLRAAIIGVDTAVGDLRTALGEISMDWSSLTGKPDAFPPTLHKDTHSTGGSDAITPADIGAQPVGDYALASDARLTNARTPTAHSSTHGYGGSDPIASLGPVTEQAQALGTITGTVTIDLSAGLSVSATVGGAVTLAFTGVPAGGTATVLLRLTNGGAYAVTWGMVPRWGNGIAPVLSENGTDYIAFCSTEEGWTVLLVASNVQ